MKCNADYDCLVFHIQYLALCSHCAQIVQWPVTFCGRYFTFSALTHWLCVRKITGFTKTAQTISRDVLGDDPTNSSSFFESYHEYR